MARAVFYKHALRYPTPRHINYMWGWGSVLALLVILQVVTGVLLACYYRPVGGAAFFDIIGIINDVNDGYMLKYLHLNGASIAFLALYIHLFRGVYYRSYL